MEISSQYNPHDVEKKWYEFWMENKFNHSEVDRTKKPFVIVIPPPNITGALHMGHALNNTLQDIFIRFYKLQGYNACWIPGTDHGGIATQNVVEKMLHKEGKNRHEIGREKFLEIMWEWRNKTGDHILHQLRKLGCLCDWDRTRFTMDEMCQKAVFTAFKTLYEKGLIYRGTYMVNWCPRCNTALSDIEVEHNEQNGKLWHIKYPFKDDPSKFIIVATTRPETMLGDSAVAVNPGDDRYKALVGKRLVLPLTGREIELIADDMVEKSFGTGAVKITPAHDPNDYETAKRHSLEHIVVIDKHGKMTDDAGEYQGLDRYEARSRIVEELEKQGLLEKIEDYKNNVSVCYRCNTVIEPLVSEQWYLNTREMADKAIKVVDDKKVVFIPESWEKPYKLWMENLHDWCISRQIWWGHRIPIWYCEDCCSEGKDGIIVSDVRPEKCPNCGGQKLRQDEDVLDTWFSSSLWPFSTLGWPNENEDLDYYYPTNVLATGHEILYLWVARMIMMGLTLKGNIPFDTVYIHGIVRDSKGKKMSKSLGNVIDPLDIIEKYGTDALRFTMTINGVMGRDLHLSDESFVVGRNFCNKLWNASRFISMNLAKFIDENNGVIQSIDMNLQLADKWILTKLQHLINDVTKDYTTYDFASAARKLYEFTWNVFCDWYLELVKSRIYSENIDEKRQVFSILVYVLENILTMFSPIIPFITDEIYSNLNTIIHRENKSLLQKTWIQANTRFIFEDEEKKMQDVIDIVAAGRNIKGEMNIPLSKKINLHIKTKENKQLDDDLLQYIKDLLFVEAIIQGDDIEKPSASAVSVVSAYELYIPLKGIIDIEKEKNRLLKEIANVEGELDRINKKLMNENFVNKAPKEEVEKAKEKKESAFFRIEKLKNNLKDFSE